MKSERKRLTNELEDLCRQVIRLRDNNTCQRCGKKIQGSNSHPCHVVAKGKGASKRRWDLLNIFLGCMHCHRWWHNNPTESAKWFADRFPVREEYLEIYRGGKPALITIDEMKQTVEAFKQKIIELKDR